MAGRSIWVVDAAYLIKAAPGKFDYLRLKGALEKANGSAFAESYYLNSTPNPPTDQQDGFYTWLKTALPRGPRMRVRLSGLSRCDKATWMSRPQASGFMGRCVASCAG
jgi:hypothetical protein